MSAADLHRARAVIARADATVESRLLEIRDCANRLSICITPALLAAVELLDLARQDEARGVCILPPHDAVQLFDLVQLFAGTVDIAWENADAALIEARQRLARQAANERQAA